MIRSIISTVLFMISFTVDSQTIVTDRPDQTESSSTVAKRSLQIETGMLFGASKNDGVTISQTLAPSTLLRYGITKGIELRFVNQFESLKNKTTSDRESGMNDLELGIKFQILRKETVNTEIAFLSHVILPIGSKELTIDKFGTINKLSISHAIGEIFGIGYNVGYNYFGVGKGDFTYSIAFAIGLTPKIGIYIEPYGDVIEFDNHESKIDAVITYLLKDNIQFDVSFGTGINHKMNYTALGMSINFAKEKNKK